jgi:hypothetical protein
MRVHRPLVLLTLALPFLASSTDFLSTRTVAVVPDRGLDPMHAHVSHLQDGSPGATTPRQVSVALDGARDPHLVPDVIAARLFIRSLTQPDRRNLELARLQLSPSDRAAFVEALGAAPERMVAIADQRQSLSRDTQDLAAANGARLALKAEEDQLLDATYAQLMHALSGDGAVRLHQHLQTYVKPRVKGFRIPH